MKEYRSGMEFEEAIFGRHSSGLPVRYKNNHRKESADFNQDMRALISQSKSSYPNTNIGRSLYSMVKRELEGLGINAEKLVLLDALDTKVDWLHFSDGSFYLPSELPEPGVVVTFDVFNLDPKQLVCLKESWIDSFLGEVYSGADFQSDLFRYKKCLFRWMKLYPDDNRKGTLLSTLPDFWEFTEHGRPENHFIFTPFHLGTYRRRRDVAKMVVGYLVKAIKEKTEKMAQQSP